jgi:hypothetical protein
MAQAGLITLMQAMADQIAGSVDGLVINGNTVNVQVEPKLVVNPTPPTIDIYPGSVARDTESAAFDDISGGYLLTVRTRVSTADNEAGQDLLLRFMDDTDDLCIAAALFADPTLDGWASSLTMRDPTGYTMFPDPGGEGALLGFSFTAIVLPATS